MRLITRRIKLEGRHEQLTLFHFRLIMCKRLYADPLCLENGSVAHLCCNKFRKPPGKQVLD